MSRSLINPPGTEEVYEAWKFSQAVKVNDTIWVSGQVGIGSEGIPESVGDQAQLALSNLKGVLEHAGSSMTDVVETVVYLTDMETSKEYSKARDKFFLSNYPASTVVQVSGLAVPQLKIEIRATAIVGSSKVQ